MRTFEQWTNEQGITFAFCCICGRQVSTADVPNEYALEYCGDCGRPTCGDHREDSSAARCEECHAEYSAYLKSFLLP